jgi:DNA (cytosine-5)-methyltransferase 1
MNHKFPYEWNIADGYPAKGIEYHGKKVFSCFACGGGSTMGYKLAGYEVIGCNEIDPKMMAAYIANHNPKYSYLEPIQTFKLRNDLPSELYELDILDGSPPCSSFSMAGNRQKDWGKEKKFREGQAKQELDTLFFDFIDLAKKLQPKVVIAENVKGLLMGRAKSYVRRIYKELDKAGYYVQHWLLDASKMGVPQRRERVFFIALRKDLAKPFLNVVDMFNTQPILNLDFNEEVIPYGTIKDSKGRPITKHCLQAWNARKLKDTQISHSKVHAGMKGTSFNTHYAKENKVLHTLLGRGWHSQISYAEPIHLSNTEWIKGGTFPQDYNFLNLDPTYLIGMSVPPVMTAQIANQIYLQWLNQLK